MTGKQKTPSKPNTNSPTDAKWKTKRLSTLPQVLIDYMAKPFSYQNDQTPMESTLGNQPVFLHVTLHKTVLHLKVFRKWVVLKLCLGINCFWADERVSKRIGLTLEIHTWQLPHFAASALQHLFVGTAAFPNLWSYSWKQFYTDYRIFPLFSRVQKMGD